jgi:hypothetical protein
MAYEFFFSYTRANNAIYLDRRGGHSRFVAGENQLINGVSLRF